MKKAAALLTLALSLLPLTTRAKGLFAAQSLVSLTTIAVVGARAVNILS